MRWAALAVALFAACSAPHPDASAPGPALAAQKLTADQIFASICSRCHGPEGRGGPPDSTGVGPRNFHDHAFQRSRSDDDLTRVVREGKDGHMPAFGAAFDEAQLAGLVARIRSFDPQEAQR